MARSTLTPERTRRFGSGNKTLEHPVDILGRALFRATLELTDRSIERRDDGQPIGFKGTAILFNKRTWIGSRSWGFWEQIAPEAVTKTLQEADIRFLQNHNPDLLLARNKAGTLRLEPTEAGLAVDADMAPVSYAQDLAVLLERQDINQMSFAFEPIAWKREEAEDGEELFTITELRLYDVSVVTYPAYVETDAGLRGAAFDALCRTNDLEPDTVLRGYADGGELPTITAPAETTRTTEEVPPPAESTEERELDPGDRLRELTFEQHARRMTPAA